MQQFVDAVAKVNGVINDAVWGLPGLILLIGTGVLLTVGTKVFQISRLGHWWRETIVSIFKKDSGATKTKDKKNISQFQALCAALAATIGTGNIAGVAAAIVTGGPGAVVQWLRDELHLITEAADTEYFAMKVKDNGGVYVVPAFAGLGAPHWDMYARGAILGLTRGAGRNHIIRAALESIAYQTADVLSAMERDTGISLNRLNADGGASANSFLMHFQADVLGREVCRPVIRETTALGAAMLAGLAVGFWDHQSSLLEARQIDCAFPATMEPETREKLLRGWHKAVQRCKDWEE